MNNDLITQDANRGGFISTIAKKLLVIEEWIRKHSSTSHGIMDINNYLMDSGFWFAQRQAPGTLTTIADNAYGPDRWRSTRANADLQYIRQDGSGETGLTSPYYGQWKKITNAGKFLLCQPLENLDTLKFRGNTVSFQLKMKASAAKTIKIAVVELQAAGTADSLPAALVAAWGADGTDPTLGANLAVIGTAVSCSVTTSWATFQFTGTVPATSKNLMVMVWSNAGFAVNDTLSLAEAGLFFGTILRSWTPRPIAMELALCKRYARAYTGTQIVFPIGTGFAATTTIAFIELYFEEMRSDPSLVATAADWQLNDGTTQTGLSAISIQSSQGGKQVCTLRCEVAAGLTANRPMVLNATAADKILCLSSEL